MNSKKSASTTGVVKRHPDGYGFLVSDDKTHPDVYMPKNEMTGIMSNDHIKVNVLPEPGGERFRGRVEEVLERGTKKIVGSVYKLSPVLNIIKDQDGKWGDDLIVDGFFDGEEGDLAVLEITSYPDEKFGFRGKIVEVIGSPEDPMNDNMRVLIDKEIPYKFSEKCIAEVEAISEEIPLGSRKDLRDLNFITIDGETAKDFDDAIYVDKKGDGFTLYVAIADVSEYVKEGSDIDIDAYERGTSTYFPGFVAPMLPEKLSNNLCSLKPNVDRYAFVAEINLDFQANLVGAKFYEALIKSHARLTYGQAQEIIDKEGAAEFSHVKDVVLLAEQIARLRLSSRRKNGTLEFEVPEVVIQLDPTGKPTDILSSNRIFAHQLIEELMLAANISVAEYFTNNNIPSLFRIHESPKPDALIMLEQYLELFGGKTKLNGTSGLQKKISKALKQFKGQPQELILNILALRSMKQAVYSSDNVGHFGLGFENYSHFTSPIRRYPDLIVHRVLKASLQVKGYSPIKEDKVTTYGNFLSACEQRSVKAERQIVAIKKARFMQQFLGAEFDGVINSITKFGFFVIIKQYGVDGLIRVEDLGGDYYIYDEENMRLVGKKSGFAFVLGDEVKIQITSVDIDNGQVNFTFLDHMGDTKGVDFKDVVKKTKSRSNIGDKNNRKKKSKKRDSKSKSKPARGKAKKRRKTKKNR